MPRSSSITDLWQALQYVVGSVLSGKSIASESFLANVARVGQRLSNLVDVVALAAASLLVSTFDMRSFHALLSLAAAATSTYTFLVPDGRLVGVEMVWDSDNFTWGASDRAWGELTIGGSTHMSWDSAQQSAPGLIHASCMSGTLRTQSPLSLFPLDFRFKRPQAPVLALRTTTWTGSQSVVYLSCLIYVV
jgi:hypothetical protein